MALESAIPMRSHTLADLPPELLNLVTHHIYASDLCSLFSAGDTTLNRKLLNGGVESINCHFSTETASWRFPLLKAFKKLKHFSVYGPTTNINLFGLHVIDCLPRTLESMELQLPNALTLWIRITTSYYANPRYSEYVIGAKFPFLRSLKLLVKANPTDTETDVLGSMSSELQLAFLKGLPQSLRSLTIGGNMKPTDYLKALPRKLTRLELLTRIDNYECLPKSLESLILHEENAASGHMVRMLPRSLKSLKICDATNFPGSAFADLPRDFHHLILPLVSSGISESDLGLLPRSLLTLSCPSLFRLNNSAATLLPPTLTALRLGACPVNDAFFAAVPKTITVLEVGTAEELSPALATLLPPRLLELSLPQNISLSNLPSSNLPYALRAMVLAHVENHIKSSGTISPIQT